MRPSLPAITLLGALAATNAGAADLIDTARDLGGLNTFVAAAEVAGLTEMLRGAGPFTLFVPSDAAFARLGEPALAALLAPANAEALAGILAYHIVPEATLSITFVADPTGFYVWTGEPVELPTLDGRVVMVSTAGSPQFTVRVNDIILTRPDVIADNGVIHIINGILTPAP
jgi:uncharacterized surface protein with fasciclin (FAS1) repeats